MPMSSTPAPPTFQSKKDEFDVAFAGKSTLERSLVPVNGKFRTDLTLRAKLGEPLEEYYKWQFIHAVTKSGVWSSDCVGAEVYFPKGSKGSLPLKVDAALFDTPEWIDHYPAKTPEQVEWLSEHLLASVEFKRGLDTVAVAYTNQLKPAMKQKEPGHAPILGVYYDEGRMWLFSRVEGHILRLDQKLNDKAEKSKVGDLNLHLPDAFELLPTDSVLKGAVGGAPKDISTLRLDDLSRVTSISTTQVKEALSAVLRTMDKQSLDNQRGYSILIQALAMKIFDEQESERSNSTLQFYVTPDELSSRKIDEDSAQTFVGRMETLYKSAFRKYPKILGGETQIDWKAPGHVQVLFGIVQAFQRLTLTRSKNSDLYQLVFYQFANHFTRSESAQFLTPIPIIDFLVKAVNPRRNETVFDPCCGIADFLSLSFVHVDKSSDEQSPSGDDFFGLDIDPQMVTLATLNMLLNGDGEARIEHVTGLGSLEYKFKVGSPPSPVALRPKNHAHGNWDAWNDQTVLEKFDVVLTNPPFGEDRAFRPETAHDFGIAEAYETWHINDGKMLDLGVMFLENTVRSIKPGGRFGIVLSNSIASINKWESVRTWLLTQIRLVAAFDLPSNVFAETGVNTTILIGYKPKDSTPADLLKTDYEVFLGDIRNVGYEKRTQQRVTVFRPKYLMDPISLEVAVDASGAPILDEEFTSALKDFDEWVLSQETELRNAFRPTS